MTTTTKAEFKNEPMTRAELAAMMTSVYVGEESVPFSHLGNEEYEAFVALGLLTEPEMKAAVLKYADWFGGDLDGSRITQGWAVFTPHHPDCDGLFEPAEPDLGPCSCEELYSWWFGDVLSHVAEANAKRPGALAVTELRF